MQDMGFIGLGKMSGGIYGNLIKNGYNIAVYDQNPAAIAGFKGKTELYGNSYDLFTHSECTFLSLPFSKQVEKLSAGFFEKSVKNITLHVGAVQNDPKSPIYLEFVPSMKKFVEYCQKNGQIFCFETGQELPSTLKRTIIDIGDNAYVNLDPANLILYGMAHPLDAVEIFGEYVKGLHAKDALWPNRDEGLGIEVPIGKGEVNFPLLLYRLKEKGFKGPVTIEREISGEEQKKDILEAKKFLEPYL